MSQGIKSYSKTLEFDARSSGKGYVNLNKANANLNMIIPLYVSNWSTPVNISLIFSLKDKTIKSEFGYGMHLNWYQKLKNNTNSIDIENSDYSIDIYEQDKTLLTKFLNNETARYITKEGTSYKLCDNLGNYYLYSSESNYPTSIYNKKGKEQAYSIVTENNIIKEISSKAEEKIVFTKDSNNLISDIVVTRNIQGITKEVFKIKLEYTNSFLTSIIFYSKDNKKTYSVQYENSNNKIIMVDVSTNYRVCYEYNNENEIISIKDGYDESLSKGKYYSISYVNSKETIVKDYRNNATYYYFDDDNMPLCEINDKAVAISYEYNSNKKLINISNAQANNSSLNNIIKNGSFNDGLNNWEYIDNGTVSVLNNDNNEFREIIGTKSLKLETNNSDKLQSSTEQTVDFIGGADDNLTLNYWYLSCSESSEEKSVENNIIYGAVNVSLYKDTEAVGEISIPIKKEKSPINWIFKSYAITPQKNFNKITIKLSIIGKSCTCQFKGISLINKSFGNFYKYDDNNNLIEGLIQGNLVENSFGEDGNIKDSMSTSSAVSSYKYDSRGNITEIESIYGVKVENSFDSKDNVIDQKIYSGDGKSYIERKTQYNSSSFANDKEYLISETSPSDNKTQYKWEETYKIIKEIEEMSGIKEQYEYDEWNNISRIVLANSLIELNEANYEYESDTNNLKRIVTKSGTSYTIEYDEKDGKVRRITTGDSEIVNYEYEEINTSEGIVSTGNIYSLQHGQNGDIYSFSYDNNDNIKNVFLKKKGATSSETCYSFSYDELGRLIKYIDVRNNNYSINFKYNAKEELNEVVDSLGNKIKYSYDNLGNKNEQKIETNEGTKINQSFEYTNRSVGKNPQILYKSYKYISGKTDLADNLKYYTCFFSDEENNEINCTWGDKSNLQKESIVPTYGKDIKAKKDGLINCVNYAEESEGLGYKVNIHRYDQALSTIFFWYKVNELRDGVKLLSIKNHTNNHYIEIFMREYGELELSLFGSTKSSGVIRTNGKTKVGEWNFVGLSFYNRQDDVYSPDIAEYNLALNDEVINVYYNERVHVDLEEPALINIGCERDSNGKINSQTKLNGEITFIYISNANYINGESIRGHYLRGKEYLINASKEISDKASVAISGTNIYNFSLDEKYDIIALNNSLVSYKGQKPYEYEKRNNIKYDNDNLFNINNKIKRFAYVADGAKLGYNYNLGNSGTIVMKVYITSSNDKQYLIENVDKKNNKLGIYRNENNQIVININEEIVVTKVTLKNDEWETVAITWEKQNTNYVITVKTATQSDEKQIASNISYSNAITYLGSRNDNDVKNPLYGQIEMVVISGEKTTNDVLTNLINQIKVVSIVKEYDELGLIKSKSILNDSEEKIKHTYEARKIDNTRITPQIAKETIKLRNENREYSYEYNKNDNLSKINKNGQTIKTYNYNLRGFLTNEDLVEENIQNVYEYDDNGNVTKKYKYDRETLEVIDSYEWIYDDVIKDRVIGYGRNNVIKDIKYGDSYELLPTQLTLNDKEVSAEWEGVRLSRIFEKDNTLFNYKYKYDSSGRRTQKDYSTSQNTQYINYYYNNDELYKEEKYSAETGFPTYQYYIYDEQGILSSIIYKDNRYYYVRDVMGNIIGLTDVNGTIVVEYNYDAWGNIIAITGGMKDSLGVSNPFRYKGYYYDNETGLYWVSTRYYSPELCRWLTPDSIDYLDPESINGLNLYCYCYNNPVMYVDPSGHLPKWAAWLISGVAIVGGIALCATGVCSILGGILIGAGAGSLINGYVTEANGGDFTAGYIGGTISGALCGVGAGLGGLAFAAASEVANLACIGCLTLGVGSSFAGGFAGNLLGTIYTSWHNSGFKNVDIDWKDTLATSSVMGALNIFAGMGSAMSSIAGNMGKTAIDLNSRFALRFLAGLIAGGTEATYDLISYLLSKLISAF